MMLNAEVTNFVVSKRGVLCPDRHCYVYVCPCQLTLDIIVPNFVVSTRSFCCSEPHCVCIMQKGLVWVK